MDEGSAPHEYAAWCADSHIGSAEVWHRRGGWWSVELSGSPGDVEAAGYSERDVDRPHGFRSEQRAQDYAEDYAAALVKAARQELSAADWWDHEPVPGDTNPYDDEFAGEQIPHVGYAQDGYHAQDLGGYGYGLRRTWG